MGCMVSVLRVFPSPWEELVRSVNQIRPFGKEGAIFQGQNPGIFHLILPPQGYTLFFPCPVQVNIFGLRHQIKILSFETVPVEML